MIAEVIVDVPSGQTDRLFDYEVPLHLTEVLEVGMRVTVPFGPRKIQGFVVSFKQGTGVAKLKSIDSVLDVTPVLTNELLELAIWLAQTTVCFKITAFQAMLPAALRAKYKKEITVATDNLGKLPPQLQQMFQTKMTIDWEEIVKCDPQSMKLIKKSVTEDLLHLEYKVKDKVTKKKVRMIRPSNVRTLQVELEKLDFRAKKQKEVIQFFIDHYESISITSLIERTSSTRSTIQTLINKGVLLAEDVTVLRDPHSHQQFKKSKPLKLTEQQQQVMDPILASIEQQYYQTFLLHGVTGSGKTEVYLQSIDCALQKGKEAIVLVPEISLTPQMVRRFKERFGSQVAVLHSGLSNGEKYDEWLKIHSGDVKVVVGARSAIFAPFKNIGIIIIDEEHESTYKQEETPRYHAREVAIKRARHFRCPLILGSATPSLESFARAQKGVYHLLSLQQRVNQMTLPAVEIIDMREELKVGNRSMFSSMLHDKILDRLNKGEQSVIFLNRRGYSTFVMCRDCGYVAECPHCDISLTYHQTSRSLKCHYCGHQEIMPKKCGECASEQIRFFGSGTQKVEEEIAKVFPGARVIRMDVDTTRKKGSHERLLTSFGEGKADILLGTQMIAKGLDFPNITLVGVLAADSMLHLPDFRSAERTFQLLTQVSGRAGRHQLPGEVVVQTYTPDHYSVELVKKHDYFSFYEKEMAVRKQSGYPPYYFVAIIQVTHPELTKVVEVTGKIAQYIRHSLSDKAIILGPVTSPIARMKDRYRYQCMIKYKNEPNLVPVLHQILENYKRDIYQGNLMVSVDMNPFMMM